MKHMHFSTARINRTARTALMFAALAATATLAGCGGSAPLFAPDGRPTSQVQCSAAGPWDACWEHAKGICGGTYDVVRESTADGVRTLLFACNAPK